MRSSNGTFEPRNKPTKAHTTTTHTPTTSKEQHKNVYRDRYLYHPCYCQYSIVLWKTGLVPSRNCTETNPVTVNTVQYCFVEDSTELPGTVPRRLCTETEHDILQPELIHAVPPPPPPPPTQQAQNRNSSQQAVKGEPDLKHSLLLLIAFTQRCSPQPRKLTELLSPEDVENVQSLLSARPICLLSVSINVTECIVSVSGYDPLTFLSCPFLFLIGWEFYGPNYLRS